MRFGAFTTVAASAGGATDAAGFPASLHQQADFAEELEFEASGQASITSARRAWTISPIRCCWARTLPPRAPMIRIGRMAHIATWWR